MEDVENGGEGYSKKGYGEGSDACCSSRCEVGVEYQMEQNHARERPPKNPRLRQVAGVACVRSVQPCRVPRLRRGGVAKAYAGSVGQVVRNVQGSAVAPQFSRSRTARHKPSQSAAGVEQPRRVQQMLTAITIHI